jgi:hypothetical protein
MNRVDNSQNRVDAALTKWEASPRKQDQARTLGGRFKKALDIGKAKIGDAFEKFGVSFRLKSELDAIGKELTKLESKMGGMATGKDARKSAVKREKLEARLTAVSNRIDKLKILDPKDVKVFQNLVPQNTLLTGRLQTLNNLYDENIKRKEGGKTKLDKKQPTPPARSTPKTEEPQVTEKSKFDVSKFTTKDIEALSDDDLESLTDNDLGALGHGGEHEVIANRVLKKSEKEIQLSKTDPKDKQAQEDLGDIKAAVIIKMAKLGSRVNLECGDRIGEMLSEIKTHYENAGKADKFLDLEIQAAGLKERF